MLHGHVVSNHKSHNHCVLQVFVGGVPRGATEEQIKEYSSKVGPVSPESADRSRCCIMTLFCYEVTHHMQVHSCSLVKEPGSSGQNRG